MKVPTFIGKNNCFIPGSFSEHFKIYQIFLVIFASFITFSLCQNSQTPNVDCDAMSAESGKKYHEIYVPHESNCNKFYQCTDHGLEMLKCNKDLVFFPYINGCVVRTAENCISNNQWKNLNPF